MDIQTKIDRTWDFCINKYGPERLIALCHHGSYNYDLALPDSDADAKLIIAPTWSDIIYNRKPMSETVKGPYGDINVTDIRLYIDVNLRKQNFNFIETLFTPFYCVNPDYADLWFYLTRSREAIAHHNPEEAVRTMMGQVRNQIMRWNKFDNNKTLYHLLRITHALRTYLAGERFEDTLAPKGEDHEFIMAVRQGKFGQEEMQKIFDRISQEAMSYNGAGGNVKSQDFVAECIMEHCLDRFMQRALAWRFIN
jgi:predicted nucleotidyltransferase